MNKLVIFITLIFICYGNVITVDNKFPSIGDYTTIQDAVENCNDGDTLIIYPSHTNYGSFTFNKQVTIYGSGFNLEDDLINSQFNNFTFEDGSEGSILKSIQGGSVTINTSNTTIEKCRLVKIVVNEGQEGIVIKQNRIKNHASRALEIYESSAYVANNLLANNFVGNNSQWHHCVYAYGTIIFTNNIVIGGSGYAFSTSGNISAYNNIFINGTINAPAVFEYNMCNSNQCDVGTTNIPNVATDEQFADFSYNEYHAWLDLSDFHLAENSIAIGAGLDGMDIGMYGGNEPFSDMGISELPTIYHLKVHDFLNIQDSISIDFKVRTN